MNYTSIEPNCKKSTSFQVTWEITLKCNLDCPYCGPEFHNNSIPHPSLEECLKTVDFLFEYVNIYMLNRPEEHRYVGLNVFGGESLIHPEIVNILEYIREKHQLYKNNWSLSIQTITNAIVSEKNWDKIINLVDFFTVSYHSASSIKQQDQFRSNILKLKNKNKSFHCSILMHTKYWNNCIEMIEWCKQNSIPFLPQQIDHKWYNFEFYYTTEQIKWFDSLRNVKTSVPLHERILSLVNLDSRGRSCCGGNLMHINKDYNFSQNYIPNNNFQGWYCSVNHYFVYVRQVSGDIFTNKDCKMNFNGDVAPIGNIKDANNIILDLKEKIKNKLLPVIVCQKKQCRCGLCAPKAKTLQIYNEIMKKYIYKDS